MKKLFQIILLFTAGTAFAAEDIYVMRESPRASDEPCEGRGTRELPYKTIQAAIDAAPAGANVWVGRGIYADTPTTSDSVLTRVVIDKKLKLESLEGRGVTHIVGAKDATTTGAGPNAVRGIRVTAQDVIIKGFTIRDCAVPEDKDGGGVCMLNASPCRDYLVDCVVSNCVAKNGGAVSLGTVAGCWLTDNECLSTGSGAATAQCRHINTLLTRNTDRGQYRATDATLGYVVRYPRALVNCTFAGNDAQNLLQRYSSDGGESYCLYNCLFADNKGTRVGTIYADVTNCAYNAILSVGNSDLCKTDLTNYPFASPLTGDWRPLAAAGVSQVGDAAWLATVELPDEGYRCIDAMGNPVPQTGAIFCGAIQDEADVDCGALILNESFKVEGATANSVMNCANYLRPSEYPKMLKLCPVAANETNLVHYSYGSTIRPPRRDNWIAVLPPPSGSATLTAKYAEAVIYVDADAGDDGYDGSAATHVPETSIGPKRTLQAAVDATPYGTGGNEGAIANAKYSLVIAAQGVYDEGGAVSAKLSLSNRVVVTENRCLRLLAKDGPEKTLIVGAPDPGTHDLGPNAVRCAALETRAVLQGFTVTGGYTDDGASESTTTYAGGVAGVNAVTPLVADCIVSNNVSPYCSGIRCVRAERCRIAGNYTSGGHGSVRTSTLVSCLVEDQRGTVDFLCGGVTYCYQTTIRGKVNNAASDSKFYNTLIDYAGATRCTEASGCYTSGTMPSAGAVDCQTGKTVEFLDAASGNYRLPADSDAFGAGVAPLPTIYKFVCDDIQGNVMEFDGGATVAGAYYRPATVAFLSLTVPAGGAVSVSGGSAGRNVFDDGQSVTLANDTACGRNCIGFTVNGDFVPGASYSFVAPESGVVTNVEIAALYSTDWYVNPNPAVGDDTNDGFSGATPRRTLQGIFAANVLSGDTIHAAAGVYDRGSMKQTGICASSGTLDDVTIMCRVAVPQGVRLVADEGPETTVIKGQLATDSADADGLGSDAMRCVFLDHGATICGFTLCEGRTRSADGTVDDAYAGGILALGYADCLAENCIITNCVGNRGGAGHSLTFRNCRIMHNRAKVRGAAARTSSFYGCILDDNLDAVQTQLQVDYFTVISNCTFGTMSNVCQPAGAGKVADSILLGTWNDNVVGKISEKMTRCAYPTTANEMTVAGCWRVDASELMMNGYEPVIGHNIAIDKIPLADQPAAADEVDCLGRQRVYNGARDLGAVEADWRARYARDIYGKVVVLSADPAVFEVEGEGCVRVPEGASLDGVVRGMSGRPYNIELLIRVSGGGSAKLNLGEEETTFGAGMHRVRTTIGTADIAVSVAALSGTVDVLPSKSLLGFIIAVR